MDRKGGGPLGEIPRGDKACLLSHRQAWELFAASGDAHAVFLEDDVRLSTGARGLLASDDWIPADVGVVKLEHYGPPGQRVLLSDMRSLGALDGGFSAGPDALAPYVGAAAYILSRGAAQMLLAQTICFDLPVDHLLFNPNNSHTVCQARQPWQLVPAIARQEEFCRRPIRHRRHAQGPARLPDLTGVKRELVRFPAMTRGWCRARSQRCCVGPGSWRCARQADQPGD